MLWEAAHNSVHPPESVLISTFSSLLFISKFYGASGLWDVPNIQICYPASKFQY